MPLVQKQTTTTPPTPELLQTSIKLVKVSKKPNRPKTGVKTKKRKTIIQNDVIPDVTPAEKPVLKPKRKWKKLEDVKLEAATIEKPNVTPYVKPKRKWKVKKDVKPELTLDVKSNDEPDEKQQCLTEPTGEPVVTYPCEVLVRY